MRLTKSIPPVLFLALVAGTTVHADLADFLIAHYPFNGNANDESGNGNHGEVKNGATLVADRHGNPDSAYNFDGVDDFIQIEPQIDTSNVTDFTLATWTRGTGWKTQPAEYDHDRHYVFDGHSDDQVSGVYQPGFCLFLDGLYDDARSVSSWEIGNGCLYTPRSVYDEYRYAAPVGDGNWHHLVFARKGSEFSMYFDGQLVETYLSARTGAVDMDHRWYIGTFAGNDPDYPGIAGGYTYSFKGDIDEVRIYNRALSESEVIELCACAQGVEPFLRGDPNADGNHDTSDAVFILGYLFLGGSTPICVDAADCNDDGGLNVADPVYLLSFLFLGGPPPPDPFDECGIDPTTDELTCDSFEPCQ